MKKVVKKWEMGAVEDRISRDIGHKVSLSFHGVTQRLNKKLSETPCKTLRNSVTFLNKKPSNR